jgi:hypothetical protein
MKVNRTKADRDVIYGNKHDGIEHNGTSESEGDIQRPKGKGVEGEDEEEERRRRQSDLKHDS